MNPDTREECCTPATGEGVSHVESEILRRYGDGAAAVQADLCCPTDYDPAFLKILPTEIIEKDYGCGDPSKFVREGETVVDLGSGTGKICYILSQKVGATGTVIGVDFNPKMLAVARKYQDEMAEKIGHSNVRFVKGKIQDLALDLDRMQAWIEANGIRGVDDVHAYEAEGERLRRAEPMIPDGTADVVVSNCVLNLVRTEQKEQLFREIFRVLKRGGRAVISDIVSDEDSTEMTLGDPELWSGCIAGAFCEDEFLEMFSKAGFYGIEILERQDEPWRVVDGIEYRSMTVRAFKGKEGPCWEHNQAVVYKGPGACICDDDDHTYHRGQRTAVCEKTFNLLMNPEGPYAGLFEAIEPRTPVKPDQVIPFDCSRDQLRSPSETKGLDYHLTTPEPDPGCCDAGGC